MRLSPPTQRPDLPTPDIIVTELVDSGLLGEHILPVLRHARAALLRPGGRTIPHSGATSLLIIKVVGHVFV